jgi:hypothetical protein
MPDFICIGGQRTGTTWLHHVLSSNQTIWMPPCKELHHFDSLCPEIETYSYRYREHMGSRVRHYGLAAARKVTGRNLKPDVNVRLDWDWDLRYFLQPARSVDWYKSLFETRAAAGKVTGEITPAYSLLPESQVADILTALPEIKIILILREPVERAWSHALKDLSADAAKDIPRLVDFLRDPNCFERSNWPSILSRWQNNVPLEQMLVIDFDKIKHDPDGFLLQISRFLDTPLHLPADKTGQSVRERGSSTYKAGTGIPKEVIAGIADLYAPLLLGTADLYPDIAAPWLEKRAELLTEAN